MKRKVLTYAVAGALTLALLISLADYLFRDDRPARLANADGTVALGVPTPTSFAGVELSANPTFAFYPRRDGSWRIAFLAMAYLHSDNFNTLEPANLSDVVALMPKDSHNCQNAGAIESPEFAEQYSWMVRQLGDNDSLPHNVVYALTPMQYLDTVTNRQMAVWFISCESRAPNTTSGGVASTNFAIEYDSGVATNAGYSPGFGDLHTPMTFFYQRYEDLSGEPHDDGIAMNFDRLSPKPDYIEDWRVSWDVSSAQQTFSTTGVVSSEWISFWKRNSNWVFAVIGPMLVASILSLAFPYLFSRGRH